MKKIEKVQFSATGEFTCVCGNSPDDSGAVACDAKGDEVSPTSDEWPGDLYRCNECGPIFDGDSGEVKGRCDLRLAKSYDGDVIEVNR